MTTPALPAGAFAAPADVIALAGPGYDDTAVASCLQMASSVIRGYTGQTIAAVVDDIVDVTPAGRAAILPEQPVTAVSAVLAKSIDPASGAVVWSTITAYDYTRNGLIYPTLASAPWPSLPESLRVTYTHGYETIPQDIVDAAKRLAFQFLINPTFVLTHKVGEKEDRYGAAGILSPYDRNILDRFAVDGIS